MDSLKDRITYQIGTLVIDLLAAQVQRDELAAKLKALEGKVTPDGAG